MENEICNYCNGSGEGMYDGSKCYTCGGSGEVPSTQEPSEEEDYQDYDSQDYDSCAIEWGGMDGY